MERRSARSAITRRAMRDRRIGSLEVEMMDRWNWALVSNARLERAFQEMREVGCIREDRARTAFAVMGGFYPTSTLYLREESRVEKYSCRPERATTQLYRLHRCWNGV